MKPLGGTLAGLIVVGSIIGLVVALTIDKPPSTPAAWRLASECSAAGYTPAQCQFLADRRRDGW